MQRELIILLPGKVGWDSIAKFLGKDLFPLDSSTEQLVVNPQSNDKVGDGRIYVNRHTGLIIDGTSRVRIVYDQGAMVVGGQEIAVNELVLSRLSGKQTDLLRLVIRFAKKFDCVLESRTHEQRAEDMINGTSFGRFHVKEFSSRTLEEALQELMWWHLCGISQASAEFNLYAQDRLPVRRLRVEIRKLRAVLAMLADDLNPELLKWRDKFRGFNIRLSKLRELDVALSTWRSTALNRKRYKRQSDKFSDYLVKERMAEQAKAMPAFALTKFTPVLLQFMLWIINDQVKEKKQNLLLAKIAYKQLGRRYKRMQKLVKANSEFKDDELAHELRIKAKSVRYVMQSMSGKAYGDDNRVMRSLKKLLDGLGVLHDNYVNEELARTTVRKDINPNVVYQAGIFAGSERTRALRVQKLLPGLWEKFSEDWEKWY